VVVPFGGLADRTAILKDGNVELTGEKLVTNEGSIRVFRNFRTSYAPIFDKSGAIGGAGASAVDGIHGTGIEATVKRFKSLYPIVRELTGNKTITIENDSECVVGQEIHFVRVSEGGLTPSAHTVTFYDEINSFFFIARMPASQPAFVRFRLESDMDGALDPKRWHPIAWSDNVIIYE
jgi:hypothetical protein